MTLKFQTKNQIEEIDQVIPYQEDFKWRAAIRILNEVVILIMFREKFGLRVWIF